MIDQNFKIHYNEVDVHHEIIYDPSRHPYNHFPAHHQFEINLVSLRLEVLEI